jgi:surface antigen
VPTSTLSIADGNWHNVLWVFDYAHERIEFYLDGALNVIGKLPNPPIAAQDAQWVAGAENGTLALNGDMDDLWVEDHAWTDSEVASYFSGPAFALSPPSLYFAGTGASKMTVTNSGSTVLSIPVPPTFGGFNASDFSLASDTSCTNGVTLAPGAHCTLDVSFTPSTSAAESAQLILFNGTNGSPQMALVSGGASVTSISPNPVLGLDGRQTITVFGNGFQTGQVLNYANLGRSETKVFTVTPKVLSSTELTATIPFTDASATWVIQVANPGDPACDLTTQEPNCLSFEVVGDDYTGVNVNDYPFENSPIDANIKGAQFPFRECTSYVQWRMNRNSGTLNPNHPFFFNGMGGGTWGNADTWNVNASNLHYTVDNNAEVGAIAQWVSIDHVAYVEKVNPDSSLVVSEYNYGLDDSGAKHQFGIRTIAPGKGYPENFIHVPFLTFSQNSLNFGNQTRDTTASQILTLVNGGQMPVSVTGISTSASQFSASPSNCTKVNPCSIAAGASFEITVNFTPSAQGPYATALKVSYTDVVALTQTIPLAGTGI